MESSILLVLALIIVSLFVISRCSLKCRCKNENYLTPFLQLPFNDHPVLRKRRYQHTIAPKQEPDVNIHTSASCDSSGCKCALCDDPVPGECVSRTCDNITSATNCCNSQNTNCPNCNTEDDPDCNYDKWCKVKFDDNIGGGGGGGGGDDGGNSEKIWFIVVISVLVAVALGVAFYFWMTTKHVD